MEGTYRRILDSPVHSLGLAVGPGVIGLGQLVGDAVLMADPVKGMPAILRRRPGAIAGLIGEGNAVVGQMVCSRYGKAAMTPRRNSAPASMVAAWCSST